MAVVSNYIWIDLESVPLLSLLLCLLSSNIHGTVLYLTHNIEMCKCSTDSRLPAILPTALIVT